MTRFLYNREHGIIIFANIIIVNMRIFLLIPVFSLLLMACQYSGDDRGRETGPDNESFQDPPDMHTSMIALDYHGVYTGIIPCASCSGIYTEIELREDSTYRISRRYLGVGNDTTYTSKGRFRWDNTGGNIYLEDEDPPNKYMVGENRLILLDIEGKRIEGELEEQYILDME